MEPEKSLPRIDSVVPLLALDGLALGATATRAWGRYSDLACGLESPVKLPAADCIDVVDQLLDLVVVDCDAPAGFLFAGCSVAELWAALLHSGQPVEAITAWCTALESPAMQDLRASAQPYNAYRRKEYQHQYWFGMPPSREEVPKLGMAAALSAVFKSANPDWKPPKRSPYAVEVSCQRINTGLRIPTQGKRAYVQFGEDEDVGDFWEWEFVRHQPQQDEKNGGFYFELQLSLPSLETSYYSRHLSARNLFAHLRITCYDADGLSVMLLNEVQSDWISDLRKQAKGQYAPPRQAYRWSKGQCWQQQVPDCPVKDDWLEIALWAFVQYAMENKADMIAWVSAEQQCDTQPLLPKSIARELYDQRIPCILKSMLAEQVPQTMGFATYRSSHLISQDENGDWELVDQSLKPILSGIKNRASIFSLYRAQAVPDFINVPALFLEPRLSPMPPTYEELLEEIELFAQKDFDELSKAG